jgi:hypothetical protein
MKQKDLVIDGRSVTIFYETEPEQRGDYDNPFFAEEHKIIAIEEDGKDIIVDPEQYEEIETQLD